MSAFLNEHRHVPEQSVAYKALQVPPKLSKCSVIPRARTCDGRDIQYCLVIPLLAKTEEEDGGADSNTCYYKCTQYYNSCLVKRRSRVSHSVVRYHLNTVTMH